MPEIPDTVNGIESLDHPVVAVNDLDSARVTFEKLGFTVPPRGSHVEWGTGNLCIMFPDDYLEMRGIIHAERFVMDLDRHLEQFGEGLMGVAFRTDDVEKSFADLRRNGVEATAPRGLTRNFELPEGWTQPSFELCVPAAEAVEGLMHVVVLQHLTPELIRRPDFLHHANTAVGVNGVNGVIFDTDRIAAKMAGLVGDAAVAAAEDRVHLTLPTGQFIHLLLPDAYEQKFGEADWEDCRPQLGSMEIRVAELSQTARTLDENGVGYTRPGPDRIRVSKADCCGVQLDFSGVAATSQKRGNAV